MSRLAQYYDANEKMSEKMDGLNLEAQGKVIHAFQLDEINKSLAVIADHLADIAKENRAQTTEMKRRK